MTSHPALTAGRAAVIPGGASGIGRGAARKFAAMGMRVCLADINAEALERTAASIEGPAVISVPTDVSDAASVDRLRDAAYAAFGEVAVLMNNGGTSTG